MKSQRTWGPLVAALSEATRRHVSAEPEAAVGGGCINECYRWSSAGGTLFVKVAGLDRLWMFEAEAEGLTELANARTVRVPAVLGCGEAEQHAFLALEWIDLGAGAAGSEALLGERLAQLHRSHARAFGWHRKNSIGSTPQSNDWTEDWPRFFARHRLGAQLDLAQQGGYGGRWVAEGRLLCERIGAFFGDYRPQPSLLHGDLWGGNWAADASGAPVLFDPATYYGDRECDLAMTHLFGGFGRAFYRAYESAWPLDPDARTRTDLYNLYHVLNHLNLFGGGYRAQAETMIARLLAAVSG